MLTRALQIMSSIITMMYEHGIKPIIIAANNILESNEINFQDSKIVLSLSMLLRSQCFFLT